MFKQAEFFEEWWAEIFEILQQRPDDALFFREVVGAFIDGGHEFDGAQVDRDDLDRVEALEENIDHVLTRFVQWKLLDEAWRRPDQPVGGKLRVRKLKEATFKMRPKGARLSRLPKWRRLFYFFRRGVAANAQAATKKLQPYVAIFGVVFTALRFGSQMQDWMALFIAMGTAAIAAIASNI